MNPLLKNLGWCVLWIPLCSMAEMKTEIFNPIEFSFPSTSASENPFEVSFAAEVKGPIGESFQIPGFYDGEGLWKVRILATRIGEWTFTTHSDDPLLEGQTGSFSCTPNAHPNVHGRLRVDPNHPYHFVYEDGTRYFLMGYECDWLWALDMGKPETPTLHAFLDQLAGSGFNQIILNGYAHDTSWMQGKTSEIDYGPPPMFAWEGTNEAPDHSRMNLAYWKHYDRVIEAMFERGIEAHLMIKVYNKKVKWPERLSKEDDLYFRWLIARYCAYPNIIWDFSKESYNEKDPEYKRNRLQFIRDNDPYDHLITVHDDDESYENGGYDTLLDFQSDQQHKDWHNKILEQRSHKEWPVVNVEFGYEHGPGGPEDKTYKVVQSGEENVRRAWEICMAGGYPAYYYTFTAWDVIRPGDIPKGYELFLRLRKFFEGTGYWKMQPTKGLIDNGYALANPGEEYLFYFPEGKESEIDLSGAKGSLTGKWFQPYTGKSEEIGNLEGGKQAAIPPSGWEGSPAVLHLRRE